MEQSHEVILLINGCLLCGGNIIDRIKSKFFMGVDYGKGEGVSHTVTVTTPKPPILKTIDPLRTPPPKPYDYISISDQNTLTIGQPQIDSNTAGLTTSGGSVGPAIAPGLSTSGGGLNVGPFDFQTQTYESTSGNASTVDGTLWDGQNRLNLDPAILLSDIDTLAPFCNQ